MEAALNLAIWLPFAAALAIALLPAAQRAQRALGGCWLSSGITLVLAAALALSYFATPHRRDAGPQFVTNLPWIPQLGVNYFVGLDGISLPMFVLNALLVFLAVLVSWNTTLRPREYFALLLVLETAVSGVFASLDLFLFFLFWELELAPMFLLIGIWGGARREYAAMKFILYTVAGSAFMLVGILVLYFAGAGPIVRHGRTWLPSNTGRPSRSVVWLLLFIGFAVKVPIFPLHTWLPDAHTEAPTAVSVLLAGVLLKMGAYGLLRVNVGMLPDAARQFAMALAVLAVISMLYGALVAMVQTDLKRVIANSSISHMGYVVLGAAGADTDGARGRSGPDVHPRHDHWTALHDGRPGLRPHPHPRDRGPGRPGRAHAVHRRDVFVVAALASLGFPGLSGFVAEFLVFIGSFPVWQWATVIAVFTIVVTAGYMLWLLERVFFGPERPQWGRLGDASRLEVATVGALLAVIVIIGIFPAIAREHHRSERVGHSCPVRRVAPAARNLSREAESRRRRNCELKKGADAGHQPATSRPRAGPDRRGRVRDHGRRVRARRPTTDLGLQHRASRPDGRPRRSPSASLGVTTTSFSGAFAVDTYAIYFKLLFLAATALVLLVSTSFVDSLPRYRAEFVGLLLFATTALMFLASANELITLYIALEMSSLSIAFLSAWAKRVARPPKPG